MALGSAALRNRSGCDFGRTAVEQAVEVPLLDRTLFVSHFQRLLLAQAPSPLPFILVDRRVESLLFLSCLRATGPELLQCRSTCDAWCSLC